MLQRWYGSHLLCAASAKTTVMFAKLICAIALFSTQIASAQDTVLPAQHFLDEVVVTANREGVKRSQAPVAISSISSKTIKDAKAISIDQLLNKVSGVNMVNLGNEQHQMSIRQPMTTKSLFLYLDDGIPIRTSGLFNHNALLEINMANVRNIEVIKGPSSSMYGSEAIGGVVNFISYAPTLTPELRLAVMGNDRGYRRTDLQTGFTSGKVGVAVSGYYADRNNNYMDYNNYHKSTLTARVDYKISENTNLINKITWLDYYSDMPGGIDSTMFARKDFRNPQTFTYRKVQAWRYQSTISHKWSEDGKTSLSIVYRDNLIEQNPAYRIKDDYRKRGDVWSGRKDLAHGEINKSSFDSYAFVAQHKQNFHWMNSVLIGGISADFSPSAYTAQYIKIRKDAVANNYVGYEPTDSTLSDYKTKISNYASFLNFEFSPVEKLRVVASVRYDLFRYDFNNNLPPSSFSGAPDAINDFSRISSKIGFTYNFSSRTGLYANYSEGFIPPQVTEMYNGVKVPDLKPSLARNYEAGGWFEIISKVLTADVSVYRLNSTNEVVSTKLDDGSFANLNAGKTRHEGVELGLNATPSKDVTIRWSGAYSKHKFVQYHEKGETYDGNEMNGAPNWMYNTEVWYKPRFMKGFRIGAEVQHIGNYFADAKNTSVYEGYTVLNLRAGYEFKSIEVWINAMNITDNYYANIVTKSSSGYSFTLADPKNIYIGFAYNFGNLFKSK
jgi:outer membrane receptor protein involved in Fe transport